MRDGGLAVRPRHADEFQVLLRGSRPGQRQGTHGRTHLGDQYLRQRHGNGMLDHECGGSGGRGRGREVVAVVGSPRHTAEERPGADLTGVFAHGGDRWIDLLPIRGQPQFMGDPAATQ